MASTEELIVLARAFASGACELEPYASQWDALNEDDQHQVLAFAEYERRFGRGVCRSPQQRKARRLLRSLLAPWERREWSRNGEFHTIGSAGGRYRIRPSVGQTWRLEFHGARWFGVSRFCLHDEGEELPPADIAVAHYLLLRANEPAFLALANEHIWDRQMWNPAYLRGLREVRRLLAERRDCETNNFRLPLRHGTQAGHAGVSEQVGGRQLLDHQHGAPHAAPGLQALGQV